MTKPLYHLSPHKLPFQFTAFKSHRSKLGYHPASPNPKKCRRLKTTTDLILSPTHSFTKKAETQPLVASTKADDMKE